MGFTALYTPGHASDHLCFSFNGVLFSGDHVMSWSSTVVSPPDGDMAAYFGSLMRLLERNDSLYLPGHGPPLFTPHHFVRELLAARKAREAEILGLVATGSVTTAALVSTLYHHVHPDLHGPAERIVHAHLLKLETEGYVTHDGAVWRVLSNKW
jgi:glyoxylase-like metal-dependent hydrolase (beta-lactamase superfamily II)